MNNLETIKDQPHQVITFDDVEFCILGTAHISKKSAEVVELLIDSGEFDAVAIELDEIRYRAISEKNRYRNMDLISIIKNKQTGLIATNLAMSAYQKRLAEQIGVEPGAEMKQAIRSAKSADLGLWRIDRSIGTTMKRTWRSLKFLEKAELLFGFGGFFEKQQISEQEIEKLKSGDLLESTFGEFSENSENLYQSLIAERDLYMAARLQQEIALLSPEQRPKKVLVVIGAGHLKGLAQQLDKTIDYQATIAELDQIPPKSKWIKYLPWLITLIIIGGFVWGFSSQPEIGWNMIKIWIIYNGVLSAIGALLAGGHLFTIIAAMLAAPFTSLNPTIAAGMVAALVEAMVRKPKVEDFENLQNDAMSFTGWWKNPVTKVLLVFILTNVGSSLGTWISGFKIFSQVV